MFCVVKPYIVRGSLVVRLTSLLDWFAFSHTNRCSVYFTVTKLLNPNKTGCQPYAVKPSVTKCK